MNYFVPNRSLLSLDPWLKIGLPKKFSTGNIVPSSNGGIKNQIFGVP
jgi:hypothetical protein